MILEDEKLKKLTIVKRFNLCDLKRGFCDSSFIAKQPLYSLLFENSVIILCD